MREALALNVGIALCTVVFAAATTAQSSPKAPAPKSAPAPTTKKRCEAEGGFCFRYPTTWEILGEGYINGVILAPRQKGDPTLWDEITVATIVLAPGPGQPPTSIGQVIETAMTGMRTRGLNPETLQRQQRTVDGNPAQEIKLRYHDPESARDWIEQLVFIEGPDQEIYSIALKCAPEHAEQMEPAMAAIVQSWKLSEEPAPSGDPDKHGSSELPRRNKL